MSTQLSDRKLNSSDINGGYQFEIAANAWTLNMVNYLVEGVLYADDNVDTTLEKVNNITFIFNAGNPALPVQTTKTVDETTGYITYTVTNIRGIQGVAGNDGAEVQLRVSGGYFQWKYDNQTTWTNLIAVADIVTVDTTLSTTSTNAIANKAVATALNLKANQSTTYTKTETDTQISNAIGQVLQGSY